VLENPEAQIGRQEIFTAALGWSHACVTAATRPVR
jgi:hypothetical protein